MACAHGESDRHVATINILPDDILLEIFAFRLPDFDSHLASIRHMRVWQRLMHVCQRWRRIVYASPRYLDLHLYCSSETTFRKNLSLWPEFPLAVESSLPDDQDDFIAVLEHPDRVRRVDLTAEITKPHVVEVMRVPFPALTHLQLTGPKDEGYDPDVLDLPDDLLGGSAPCLRHLILGNLTFPGLPTLLSSAHDLVSLDLYSVPPTGYDRGYISPKEMASSLAVLTKLRTLSIDRYSLLIPSHEERRRPDPPMLTVLPALTQFVFGRDFEYLEDLVAQIDAPRVEDIRIEYSMKEVQTRQLSQFIGRSNLKRAQFRRAKVTFGSYRIYINLDLPQGECLQAKFFIEMVPRHATAVSQIMCVVHVLDQLVAMTSKVDHLQLDLSFWITTPSQVGQEGEWLPLLHLFSAVEVLEVFGGLVGCIASALEDTAEETPTISLPELQLLWLGDDNCKKPERFLSSRQLSGRPIIIVDTQDEFVERLNAHWKEKIL
ncbi:hypothetical protein EDB92DRAFT_1950892 [Lactarius akahatsu]|uniref:F-box domain-containing protein n=1 Tax=Lactarius akahatsu TaxID=416441 RepID=A0AAD4LDI1_9AGAM|nr:hypothetical protein EDB92DRAFT_1950892 [Lactarius akahatsu]